MGDAPASPEIDVAAGLVFRDGRLLITQRQAGDHMGGLWEFPGGKRHSGETFPECLERELREELGIEVRVGELFAEIAHAYPDRRVRLKFFECRWMGNEPEAIGCSAWRWIRRAELAEYEFPPADARLLEAVRASAVLPWT